MTWVPIITVNTGRHWRLRGVIWSVWRLNRPPCTIVVIVPLTILRVIINLISLITGNQRTGEN